MLDFNTQKRQSRRLSLFLRRALQATTPMQRALKTGVLATVLICCFFGQELNGQCTPDITPPTAICVGPFIIALNGSGQATINPSDIDNGSFDGCGAVNLAVSPSLVTCAHIPLSPVPVTLTVTDMAGNTNFCITTVTVQDNLPPVITCPTNRTRTCTQSTSPANTGTATAVDNCALSPMISHSDLNINVLGPNCYTIQRTWSATDSYSNTSTCIQLITVTDNTAPVFTSATIPSPVSVSCEAFPPAMPPAQTATDNCSTPTINFSTINGQDPDPSTCGHYQYTFIRIWDAVDACGNITSRSQVINVSDNTAPTFPGAPANMNVSASPTCLTSVNLSVTASDNCAAAPYLTTAYEVYLNTPWTLVASGNGLNASGNYLPGNYTVIFSATDPCGNIGLHTTSLNVVDNIAPTAICQAGTIQVSIPPSGTATLLPSQVNNGSYDNCTPTANLTFSLSGSTFNCGDVGILFPNIVTLTVTDANGNSNSCTASVLVVNNSPPAVFCQDLTVTLSGSGTVSVSASSHDDGSFDLCDANGILTFHYVEINGSSITPATSYTFGCLNVGVNDVRVRIREIDNNQVPAYINDGFCNQTVTVIDNTPPIAQCTTRTVYLNQAGMWSLTPADAAAILGSSSDACGFTAAFSQTMFTCADFDDGNPLNGPERQITVTLTDPSNNTASCTALIVVLDTIPPMISCPDTVAVCLDANGIGKIFADSLLTGGIYVSSGNNGSCLAGATEICVTVTNAVTFSFDWDYRSNNSEAGWDPFGITKNGVFTQLTTGSGCPACGSSCSVFGPVNQSGTHTVTLAAGDVFCFSARTADNSFGNAETWIKNFSKTFTGDFAQNKWSVSSTNSDGKAFFVDATISCAPITYQISLDSTTWQSTDSLFCDSLGAYVNAWLRAIDGSGNVSDTCEVVLHVEDKEPPIAACDEVIMSLNGLGQATVLATAFEQGSVDNCGGPLTFMISKDGGLNFFNSLMFNCSEKGQNEIIFKATDASGNNGFCVTYIVIQDNLPPVISCPPAATIACELAGLSPPATITGFATANDNCDGPVTPFIHNEVPAPNGADCLTFTRFWRATDSMGNTSQCTQTITIVDTTAPVLSGVPTNLTVQCTPPAPPTVTATDNCKGTFAPTYTQTDSRFACGVPTGSANCFTPAQCGFYNYTLTRTWTATDNCGNTTTQTRTVTVQDTQAPVFSYTNSIQVGNTPGQCFGFATVNVTGAVTDCAPFANLTITHTINGGPVKTGPNASGNFNVGVHTVVFTAVDPCGNTSTHTVTVTVLDNETPTAACKTGPLPITLNSSGIAAITPATVNNGSNDNCGIASLNVSPSLFDCNTSPNPHPVVLTVTDAAGNFNTCTTTVFITNASAPAIVCPGDVTVSCATFNSANPATSGGSATATTACGPVATTYSDMTFSGLGDCRVIHRTWSATTAGGTATCLQIITVEDNTAPVLSGVPLNTTATCTTIPAPATPTATDNCDSNPTIGFVQTDNRNPDPNNCGHYTYSIFRTWTATDDCGNSSSGSQTISVIDNAAPTTTIPAIWVINTDLDECFATVNENLLNYISDCAADMYLTITNNALAVHGKGNGSDNINGIWTPGDYPISLSVTDPCGNTLNYSFILRIRDNEAPQAACLPATTLILDGSGNGVLTPANIDNGSADNCGAVTLSISPSTFNTSNVGVVNVVLTVTDGEGNTSQCTTPVTVIERGTISASTLTGGMGTTVSVPVTVTGFDNICAVSFSLHLVGTAGSVTGVSGFGLPGMTMGDFMITGNDISFSWVSGAPVTVADGTPIFSVDVFLSGSVGSSSSLIIDGTPTAVLMARCDLSTVPVTTMDGGVTVVTSPANVLLSGTIETELSVPVQLVDVALTGTLGGNQTTGAGGTYSFSVPSGANQTLTPAKDINDCNGINVIDVLLLQQHILGDPANQLPTPYRRIAADINNDGTINVLDRLELHLIVLAGLPCIGLSNNTSWRFVPSSYVFPNPNNPFPYPQTISYTNVMSPQVGDFIGIKIGDLDLTNNPANFTGDEVVSDGNSTLFFTVDEQSIAAGNEYRVEFKASDFADMAAYQYTFRFDEDVLKFKHIETGALPQLTAQNFSTARADEGIITSIWYNSDATTMADGEVLFTLVFDAIGNAGKLSQLLNIASEPVSNEAYTASMEKKGIGITFSATTSTNDTQSGKMALYQNRPNPFRSETIIPFYLPQASHAVLTITDVSGKTVKVMQGDFSAGRHEFSVNKEQLPATGVFFYMLETESGKAVKKMVLID